MLRAEFAEILKTQRGMAKYENILGSKPHRVCVGYVVKRISEQMRPHYDYDTSLDEQEQELYPIYPRPPYPPPHNRLYDGESTDSQDFKAMRQTMKDPRDKQPTKTMVSVSVSVCVCVCVCVCVYMYVCVCV